MEKKSLKKFKKLQNNIFISEYLDRFSISNEEIKKYYKINKMAYRLFHSFHGFMHFRISTGKHIKHSDIYYQPNTISQYIKDGSTVLELGCGQGANLFYLSKKHKKSNFIGVDLLPLKYNKYPNIKHFCHDYSDLSFIPDESVDVIYAVETIVHNPNKELVFKEINRVLAKNGIVIIYDYALTKEFPEYLEYVQFVIKTVSMCGVSPIFDSENTWDSHFKNCNLKKISIKDYSKNVLSDLKRLSILASIVMSNKLLVKIIFSLFPKLFCGNILIGWVAYDGFKEKIIKYNEWIYKKV